MSALERNGELPVITALEKWRNTGNNRTLKKSGATGIFFGVNYAARNTTKLFLKAEIIMSDTLCLASKWFEPVPQKVPVVDFDSTFFLHETWSTFFLNVEIRV